MVAAKPDKLDSLGTYTPNIVLPQLKNEDYKLIKARTPKEHTGI